MEIEERYTVAGLIRANAARTPEQTMLVDRGRSWTWSEHLARACRVANALRSEGVGPDGRVAFLDRNGSHYFETLFGGSLCGIVNVAVNWRLAPAEMGAVIDDSRAEVLVVHRDYLPCVAGMKSGLPDVRRIVVIDGAGAGPGVDDEWAGADHYRTRSVAYEDWVADQPETDPGHIPAPGEVALQLYTSGTTGLPKGVMLSNANLATAIGGADLTFHIDDDLVSLVAMPLFHIGGSGWALCAMS